MQAKPVSYLLLLMLSCLTMHGFSQIPDSVARKISLYHAKTSTPTLFVHFDKTVYTSNEQVWFTGYLLNAGKQVNRHTIMSVALVRNADLAIITSQKFVMKDGVSSGSMLLPDSIPAGHYTLTAYTNLLEKGMPQDVFEQPVTIKTPNTAAAQLASAQAVKSPITRQSYHIKFYPEGGNMVTGLMGRVGFEVKDNSGAPANARVILYNGNKAIDTIETQGYGMGSFFLKPEANTFYSVKLDKIVGDTIYRLPAAAPTGATISTINAAVNGDTLRLRIAVTGSSKLWLVAHNYKETFYVFPVEVGAAGKTVKVPLTDIPKGLTAITLLNEQQQPLAERIFFAHYDPKQNEKLSIITDKPQYGKREKVTLSIKLNDSNLQDAKVSIAVVQGNRVEELNKQDISSYYYLKHDLQSIPFKDNYFGNDEHDKQYIENVLLIKGWRRYRWEDVIKTTDTVRWFTVPQFTGTVTKANGKLIGKQIPLVFHADSNTLIVTPDMQGRFVLKQNDISVNASKPPFFLLEVVNKIDFKDPFQQIDKSALQLASIADVKATASETTDYFKMPMNAYVKQLKEVTIKAESDLTIFGTKRVRGSNDCGDYVCENKILNCRNHPPGSPGNRPPVDGGFYFTSIVDGHWYSEAYHGCFTDSRFKRIPVTAIFNPVEFYGIDSLTINDPLPNYLSTIYWNNLNDINAQNAKAFSFYTSDITGDFKVIVQGVGTNDVVYSEQKFTVK